MKRKASRADEPSPPIALAALERAARKAIELARKTGTPAWVLEDGKLVDAARKPRRKPKKKGS